MSDSTIAKIKSFINEHVFSTIFLMCTSSLTWYSITHEMQALQVIALMLLRVSLFLSIGSIFIKFFNGIGFSVNKEVFEEHNVAAAITIAGFWIGLAIALAAAM